MTWPSKQAFKSSFNKYTTRQRLVDKYRPPGWESTEHILAYPYSTVQIQQNYHTQWSKTYSTSRHQQIHVLINFIDLYFV